MNAPQIQVKDLHVAYDGKTVLKNISFEVQAGEFVAITGRSGTGKTTLLNALAGFIPHDGNVTVLGKTCVVFQDYSVFPWKTVAGNIGFGLDHIPRRQRSAVVHNLLRRIQMEEHLNKYPAQLSGGQIQRVGLARALAPNPDVILMDEPYSALDRHTRDEMQRWLLEIWKDNRKTIVLVTHDIEEAIFLSDRVIVLRDQQIAAELTITFPRPRSEDIKFSQEFNELRRQILHQLW